jgi:hypothetical protein
MSDFLDDIAPCDKIAILADRMVIRKWKIYEKLCCRRWIECWICEDEDKEKEDYMICGESLCWRCANKLKNKRAELFAEYAYKRLLIAYIPVCADIRGVIAGFAFDLL